MRRAVRLVLTAGLGLAVTLSLGACAPADAAGNPAARPRPRIVVYGDSLTWEARDYVTFLGAAEGMTTIVRSFGGTATCDWFDHMRTDMRTLRPGLVVLAFSGNNITKCMVSNGHYLYGDALKRKYAKDTNTAVKILRDGGAQVALVGAPRSRNAGSDADWDRLHDAFRSIADRLAGVTYADGGRLITPRGRWSATQSCLGRERGIVNPDGTRPCSKRDRIAVRAPDGAHFCPGSQDAVRGVTATCPRYSSGAFRYATNIVRAAHVGVFGRP
jgi:hypothetical protein